MIGANHQNAFVNRMRDKNKNITDSPPKITKSISEITYKQASISPIMTMRKRKRKRSPIKVVDFSYNSNNRTSKRLKLRNNKNRESQYIQESYPMKESHPMNESQDKYKLLERAKSFDDIG